LIRARGVALLATPLTRKFATNVRKAALAAGTASVAVVVETPGASSVVAKLTSVGTAPFAATCGTATDRGADVVRAGPVALVPLSVVVVLAAGADATASAFPPTMFGPCPATGAWAEAAGAPLTAAVTGTFDCGVAWVAGTLAPPTATAGLTAGLAAAAGGRSVRAGGVRVREKKNSTAMRTMAAAPTISSERRRDRLIRGGTTGGGAGATISFLTSTCGTGGAAECFGGATTGKLGGALCGAAGVGATADRAIGAATGGGATGGCAGAGDANKTGGVNNAGGGAMTAGGGGVAAGAAGEPPGSLGFALNLNLGGSVAGGSAASGLGAAGGMVAGGRVGDGSNAPIKVLGGMVAIGATAGGGAGVGGIVAGTAGGVGGIVALGSAAAAGAVSAVIRGFRRIRVALCSGGGNVASVAGGIVAGGGGVAAGAAGLGEVAAPG